MKYLFIVPSLSKGGAERVVSVLSNELVKRNRTVTIIVHFKTNNDYSIDDKVKLINLSSLDEKEYRKKISIYYLLKLLIKLRKSICKEKPDYIVPFLWTTCIRTELSLVFNTNRKKIIHTVRNNPYVVPNNKLLRLIRNRYIKNSFKTIVQNNEQKEYFKNMNNIYILPNAISNNIFDIKLKYSDKIKIISVGRLEKQKNFDMLIDAINLIKNELLNVEVCIYGEGLLYSSLKLKIESLGLNNLVKLMGRVTDLNNIYGDASVYVLTSNYEGMPNTLLEAMGVGLACISTNCKTGPKDIIQDDINGYLIETNNAKELADKIKLLVFDSTLREKIGKNAKEYVKANNTISVVVDRLIDICEGSNII